MKTLKMMRCAECWELQKQLQDSEFEYFWVNSAKGPENELTKAAKRSEDELQERFSKHMASHGAALCSFGL